jgi:hypothetical protein
MFSWTAIDEGFSEQLSKSGVVGLRVLPTGRFIFISTHLQMRSQLSPKSPKKDVLDESRRREKGGSGLVSCGLSCICCSVCTIYCSSSSL